jgi:hypothetical protein
MKMARSNKWTKKVQQYLAIIAIISLAFNIIQFIQNLQLSRELNEVKCSVSRADAYARATFFIQGGGKASVFQNRDGTSSVDFEPQPATASVGIGTQVQYTIERAIPIEGATSGSTNLTVTNVGGDTVENAYTDGKWTNMEVLVNGAATPAPSGTGDFSVGDNLTITFTAPLSSGDVITVVYTPTSQTRASVTVS